MLIKEREKHIGISNMKLCFLKKLRKSKNKY